MVRHRLDQREVDARRQRGRRGVFEVEIILGHPERIAGGEMRRAIEIDRQRDAQRLRQVGFFGIDAGQHLYFEILYFKAKPVVQCARPKGVLCARHSRCRVRGNRRAYSACVGARRR